MHRRDFIALGSMALANASMAAFAEPNPLSAIFDRLEANPSLVEKSWAFQDVSVSKGVPSGTPSRRALSQTATDLIVNFEVSSPKVYEARYTRPIWPRGKSGVTIGVGYDLRFANRFALDRDWPRLSSADRETLSRVLGLGGQAAHAALGDVRSVVIHWPDAKAQFLAFLPYPAGQTEAAFANCDLLHEDCFGAMVSLVYNRGPAAPSHSDSRREMWNIKQLMIAKNFAQVPGQLRSMKRLWTTPDAAGVVLRREAEAILFEQGLNAAH